MNHTATIPRGKTPLSMPSEMDVPPSDLEAERSVLGCVMLDAAVVDSVRAIIGEPRAFHSPQNRVIWSVLRDMHDRGVGIDSVTLHDELQRRGQLEEAGGMTALLGLMEAVPRIDHAEHYAKIVRDKFNLRQLVESGTERIRKALGRNSGTTGFDLPHGATSDRRSDD